MKAAEAAIEEKQKEKVKDGFCIGKMSLLKVVYIR
jgi:hypothetical protein